MSAAEVLAQQTYIHRRSPGRCSCGKHLESPSDASHAKHLAELQLDALKAAGFAVVELPKSTHSNAVSTSFGRVTNWDKAHQVHGEDRLITVVAGDRPMNIADARDLAGNLLAAADAAEATS